MMSINQNENKNKSWFERNGQYIFPFLIILLIIGAVVYNMIQTG